MRHTTVALAFTAVAACAHTLASQSHAVVLSEIRADGAERWVELWNSSAAAVDIGSWTLYYATTTPGQANNYFYGFPFGTQLAADARLLVHWDQAAPTAPAPGEIWTGTSAYGYLFMLGTEPLQGSCGAMALIRSQLNADMSTAALFEDWVSWGASGLLRENLAVQAGLWQSNTFAPAIPAGSSLARNETLLDTATSAASEWFLDPTPTPLAVNVPGMLVQSLGAPCAPNGNHLFGLPTLSTISPPVLGNSAFGLSVSNTSGLLFENVLIAFSLQPAPNGPLPLPALPGATGCALELDLQTLFVLQALPAQPMQTTLPISLANLPASAVGLQLCTQALVFDLYSSWLPYQGISNGLLIQIGG